MEVHSWLPPPVSIDYSPCVGVCTFVCITVWDERIRMCECVFTCISLALVGYFGLKRVPSPFIFFFSFLFILFSFSSFIFSTYFFYVRGTSVCLYIPHHFNMQARCSRRQKTRSLRNLTEPVVTNILKCDRILVCELKNFFVLLWFFFFEEPFVVKCFPKWVFLRYDLFLPILYYVVGHLLFERRKEFQKIWN